MRSIKRPLTHSDKRPYKLSRAWNYTPELFSLADTDPRGMNLVSRLVSRYLLIHAFLIGRAPFFKNCVDYTTIPKACQGFCLFFVFSRHLFTSLLHLLRSGRGAALYTELKQLFRSHSKRFPGNEFVRIINRKVIP